MITLYQFPISHYCEKIRWALDFKKVDYQINNMLPGLHIKKAKAMAKTSEVPILVHGENVVQDSSEIINYLDEHFIDSPLTPEDKENKKTALEWENYVDQELGPHLRVYFYNTLLEHPDILIPIFAHKGPWYGKIVLKFIFPKLRKTMRRLMRINDDSAAKAKICVDKAIATLNAQLNNQAYLAGNRFSRADLAAASLLAPIVQPEKYGIRWPSPLPQPLQQTVNEWNKSIPWVRELYEKYR